MAHDRFPKKINLLFYFLRGSKGFFLCSLLFAVATSAFELAGPKIIGRSVDGIIPYTQGAVLAAGAAVLGAIARYLYRSMNARGAETLVKRMRDELMHHIAHLPFLWFSKNATGDIIQRCTSDVETIKRFVSEQLVLLLRFGVLIGLAIYDMSRINLKLTYLAAAFLPVVLLYSAFFHSRIGATFLKADEEEGRLSTIAQENLTGVRVVRAFGRERYEKDRFEKQNTIYTAAFMKLAVLMTWFWSFGEFISGLQVLSVLSVGVMFTVRGTITSGDLIAFVAYNSMLVWPVRMLGRVISEMSKAGVSIERIREIMNAQAEAYDADALSPPMDEDIVFDHVAFRYGEGMQDIVSDISMTIRKGETVGILGGTGSGKSTLMYLLDRLYDLEEGKGRITIGGTDIKEISLRHLREHIGIVLQEPFLFSRTLADNIGITQEDASMEAVRAAAGVADLDEAVMSFSKGYETFVGERGVTLSGGQKQRAAIAQTVIRDTPIYIFDDSLSAVDTETDARIRAQLRANTNGATVILISHRITTLMHADRIFVIHGGCVAEEGTHEELVALNGRYKKICKIQNIL